MCGKILYTIHTSNILWWMYIHVCTYVSLSKSQLTLSEAVCTSFLSPTTNRWSPDMVWPCDAVVQWNGESFKGEGPQNVSIPCNSSQEFFYVRSQCYTSSTLLDTNGAGEVSLFECMQEWYLGWYKGVLFSEVSLFQRLKVWYSSQEFFYVRYSQRATKYTVCFHLS